MCFVNDYDWYSSVQEESTEAAVAPVRCDECSRWIMFGESYYHLYQQEHEECQCCEDGDCECKDGRDADGCVQDHECSCEKPAYGETFSYDCCDECHRFLQAIKEAEQEAGCDYTEAQPPLGEMMSAINDGGMEEARKYWKTALANYPDMKPWLAKTWRRVFG